VSPCSRGTRSVWCKQTERRGSWCSTKANELHSCVTSAVMNPGYTTPDEKVPKYSRSSSIKSFFRSSYSAYETTSPKVYHRLTKDGYRAPRFLLRKKPTPLHWAVTPAYTFARGDPNRQGREGPLVTINSAKELVLFIAQWRCCGPVCQLVTGQKVLSVRI
jgi:hypothetical protein